MGFIRVRGATPGDPLHEFDVPEAEAAASPGAYVVLDPEPVADARPAAYKGGAVKAPRPRTPRVRDTTKAVKAKKEA